LENNTNAKKTIPSVDQVLIQYVKEAITTMKQEKQICNLKTIFDYLKRNKKSNRISNLSEKDLFIQLEMGVKEGILSHKFGASSIKEDQQPRLQSTSNAERTW
jgi:hypothetical protein